LPLNAPFKQKQDFQTQGSSDDAEDPHKHSIDDNITALIATYDKSLRRDVDARVGVLSVPGAPYEAPGNQASYLYQNVVLTQRNLINNWRNIGAGARARGGIEQWHGRVVIEGRSPPRGWGGGGPPPWLPGSGGSINVHGFVGLSPGYIYSCGSCCTAAAERRLTGTRPAAPPRRRVLVASRDVRHAVHLHR
jgi:hypothetical protein